MGESDVKARLLELFEVPRETLEQLDAFVALLAQENQTQNLVSAASLRDVWKRHILDSAQLLLFSPDRGSSWVDLGSGAGFPGIVVGLLHQGPVLLVEERRKRVDFLHRATELLMIQGRVAIAGSRVELVEPQPYDVISARAFAPLDRLLTLGQRFAAAGTRWVLPKGRNVQSELEAVRTSWQGGFRLEPSLTDADARIIVAEQVSRRGQGKQRQ